MRNSYAAFLLGLPDQASKSLQFPDEYHIRSMLYSSYIRDRWNVTPRLTVNYGVRWEYFPYPTRTDRGLERYDPTINKVLVCGVGPVPKDCGTDISKKRFSPRLGIAYRATDTFVIRAGFGITNDPYEGLELQRNNYPIMEPFGIQPPNEFHPGYHSRARTSADPAPVIPSSGILDLPLNVGFEGQPKNLHRGYIESWNFTLQKELGRGFTAQAGYVATRSVRQLGFVDINASQVPFTNQRHSRCFSNGDERRPRRSWSRWEPATTTRCRRPLNALQRRPDVQGQLHLGQAINFVDASSGTPYIQSQQYRTESRDDGYSISRTIWQSRVSGNCRLERVRSGWIKGQLPKSSPDGRSIMWSAFSTVCHSMSGSCGAGWPSNSPTMTNIVGSPKKIGDRSGYWYDPLAFAQTYDPSSSDSCLEGALGNSGFNNLRGPGVFNWDFGVFRDFPIRERIHLQFRAEAFNFTNTPHFCNPDNDLGNANGFDPQTGALSTRARS